MPKATKNRRFRASVVAVTKPTLESKDDSSSSAWKTVKSKRLTRKQQKSTDDVEMTTTTIQPQPVGVSKNQESSGSSKTEQKKLFNLISDEKKQTGAVKTTDGRQLKNNKSRRSTSKSDVGTAATKTNDTEKTADQQLSRGQRKRLAKRGQYLKRERMVLASLQVQSKQEQAKRIDGLDAIKDALLQTISGNNNNKTTEQSSSATVSTDKTSTTPKDEVVVPTSLLKTNKGKKLLLVKEVHQMGLVLQHPEYKSDPFATIREHLQNTIVATPTTKTVPKTKTVRKRHRSKRCRATRSKR